MCPFDNSAPTTELKGKKLPDDPIFCLIVLIPCFFIARNNVKTLETDSIATSTSASPTLYSVPSTRHIDIPYIFGFTFANYGIYEAFFPCFIFLTL